MRFHLQLTCLFLATASKATADNGLLDEVHSHENLKPHTDAAYHDVEQICAADVEQICEERYPSTGMLMPFGDPLISWILSPSILTTPPEVSDLNLFIDQMFNSILASASSYQQEESLSSSSFIVYEVQPPQFLMLDFGVAKLAAEKGPEEIPQLAQQLQTYGAAILRDAEIDSDQFRMARRLTEMDTTTINFHVQLPFGRSNCCLKHAFREKRVSSECASSMTTLEKTFILEDKYTLRQDEFVNMMWIYGTIVAVLILLLSQRTNEDPEVDDDEELVDDDYEEDVYYALDDEKRVKKKKVVYKLHEGVLLQVV